MNPRRARLVSSVLAIIGIVIALWVLWQIWPGVTHPQTGGGAVADTAIAVASALVVLKLVRVLWENYRDRDIQPRAWWRWLWDP